MIFSIVIPAFNRAYCVSRAIKSAQVFLENDDSSEIVVVDDGSTDNTVVIVEDLISRTNQKSRLTLVKHHTNKGVCTAKNTGAKAARGEWIIFLDSDDELIPDSYAKVVVALNNNFRNPIHFFSCILQNEVSINQSNNLIKRNFNQYMRYGTDGEKLPIVNRVVFNEFLYDEDMPGYESLSYMRIIKKYEWAYIYELVVRRYYTSNQDRLSAPSNMKRRSAALAKGHLRVLKEHSNQMDCINIIRQFMKYIKSLVVAKL